MYHPDIIVSTEHVYFLLFQVFCSLWVQNAELEAAEEPAELGAAGSGLPSVFLCAG